MKLLKPAKSRRQRLVRWISGILAIWFALAYFFLPFLWIHHEHNPALVALPKTTSTKSRIPGDPLNVALEGTHDEVAAAFLDAGWQAAQPITLHSSLGIAASVLLRRPDPTAPVSPLYLFGRQQDLAFEREQGRSADQRHHARLWKTTLHSPEGREVWVGSATFDRSVGLSHLTGQITHHIAADVDAERDSLIATLVATKRVQRTYQVTGLGPTVNGRNGGGDRYYTDGEITVAVLTTEGAKLTQPGGQAPNPLAVSAKNRVFHSLRGLLDWFHRR